MAPSVISLVTPPTRDLYQPNPDYLHRPSGVNDIILIGVAEAVGVEPTLTTIALGTSVYHPHVAEITRPAIGV